MERPLQITFRNMEPSPAIEAGGAPEGGSARPRLEARQSCRVVVEAPHGHHRHGKLGHVREDVTVPGGELVGAREPELQHAHEEVHVAVRDAFDAAARQLEDYTRRLRGHTKVHAGARRRTVKASFEQT